MLLFLLSYLGGVLTILSPCILPVIPFVFAKADQSFRKSGLPLLLGMAITFAAFSGLAVLGGAWAVQANTWGRWFAIALMTVFGLSLIFPQFFDRFFEPFTRLGSRLSEGSRTDTTFSRSMLLGAATGLLWAPCAGPILGLILTGAATQGTPEKAIWFLFAYALGAATSLMLALVAGGKFLGTLKKSLKAERLVKACLGVAVLVGVIAITFNFDRTVLTKISRVQTEDFESHLIDILKPSSSNIKTVGASADPTANLTPSLAGATKWLNSPSLSLESLKGKVVLVDFWTYSCINCLRTLPYVKAWAEKYKDQGLVVIGVHTPEFAFEKDPTNVAKALQDLGITYPVAMDNDYAIWNTFENRYWPAHYFFDRNGKIRHHHFGEGGYAKAEEVIQELLSEGPSSSPKVTQPMVQVQEMPNLGAQAPSKFSDVKSPETYVGYARAKNLKLNPLLTADQNIKYTAVKFLNLNDWSLSGTWNVSKEKATSIKAGAKISFRFHARDLHLVLGPKAVAASIPFRVTIDGKAPGKDHGADVNEKGEGVVTDNRLYQLIRQNGESSADPQGDTKLEDRTFEIEFLAPGVEAFAFTFG